MRTELTTNGYHKILDNGYHVSVIGGDNFYGNGKSSFEVGIWIEDDGHRTPILVQGWMDNDEIETLINTLNKFK